MRVELACDKCACRFVAHPEAEADEVLDRMFHEGPWYGLGDGETFEDMIFTALTERGDILCPECGEAVCVQEESLNRLAMEMLAHW